MKLILLGPPGSGKGTQAQKIEQKYNLKQLATGDLLRDEIKSESKIGREVKKIIDRGELVSDKIIISLIENSIDKKKFSTGFILDGFPRSVCQAKALDKILQKKNLALDIAIELLVEDKKLINRIVGRFSCANCSAVYHDFDNKTKKEGICDKCGSRDFLRRSDDTKEVFAERLKEYYRLTAPIIPYYKDKGMLKSINAMESISYIENNIYGILDSVKKQN
jgi:adenylate kinase